MKPLKRLPKFGVPACDLQLRSYSVRNLEFQADFALRAAYYLDLPASGPIPLPRIVERWTVPRSNFVHKKSQENFERITMRRLIQIQDGNVEVVEMWLAFIRKHAYHGVGMKANVWNFEPLGSASFLCTSHSKLTYDVTGVGKAMDINLQNSKVELEPELPHFSKQKSLETSERVANLVNPTS